jgi:hypothetical protein
MATTEEMPSFASEETHTTTIGGRKLTFYATSGLTFLRLQERLGPAFSKVVDSLITAHAAGALLTDAGIEIRQQALAELLAAVGKNGSLVGELVLDSLQDEKWKSRPASPREIDLFLQKTSSPVLVAMLAAVTAANAEGFRPLVEGLVESLTRAGKTIAASLPKKVPAGASS